MSKRAIQQAAEKGDIDTIRKLFSLLGEDSITDRKWKSAFFIACENGFDEIVEFLVTSGIPVDIREEIEKDESNDDEDDGEHNCRSGLMVAIDKGHLSTAKLLIKLNINLNLVDSCGITAFMTAAYSHSASTEIIKLLIDGNVNLHCRGNWGQTAFMLARRGREMNPEVVSFLLRNKVANINAVDDNGRTALMVATYYNNESNAKLLLKHEADVLVVSKNGSNVLGCALSGFRDEAGDDMVEMLVKLGVDIQPQVTKILPIEPDDDIINHFELACHYNRLKAVDIFIKQGLTKNLGRDYYVPGFKEACCRGFPKLVERLLKVPFFTEWRHNETMPFHLACEHGHDSIVELMLKHLPHQAFFFDSEESTALMIATRNGHEKVVQLILNYCPLSIDLEGAQQMTALMYAVRGGDTSIIEKLLSFKANVNAKDVNGETALMMASSYGRAEIVNILLKFKADVNIVDCENRSAFFKACLRGHFQVANILIEHGAVLTNDKVSKLLLAACKDCDEDVVKFLFSLKPECVELYGQEALKIAFQKESFSLVRFFIELGVSINYCRFFKRGCEDKTVLMNCLNWRKSSEIINFLLENKLVDVNEHNKYGKTPLVSELQKQRQCCFESVRILIQHGAVLDLRDCFTLKIFQDVHASNYGFSPYHEIIYMLIENGLKPDSLLETCLLGGVLTLACSKGNIDVVKKLFKIKTDRKIQHDYFPHIILYEGLTNAVKNKHYEIVHSLVKDWNVNINYEYCQRVNIRGSTISVLMNTCENDDEDMFNILIGYGADMEYQQTEGTPLMFAVKKGNEKFVDILMRSGCNVDTANSDQKTALILACELQGKDMVKKLLDYGANVNFVDNKGNTPLIHACRRGNEGIVELLLNYKADVNMKNSTDINKSAMHYVLQDRNESIICLLLKYGANINTRVVGGRTLLMFAAQRRMVLLTKLLISKGVDVRATSGLKFKRNKINPYKTALGFACSQPYSSEGTEIVRLLLKADKRGLQLNGHDFHHPIICAATHGNLELMKFLLNYSPVVDINVIGRNGRSALTFAAEKGHADVINFLITHGAKNNICDNTGMNALMYSAKNGHVQCVKRLTNELHGINDIDHKGSTALMFACEVGNEDIVKCILGCNPDVNIQNNNKQTALMFACMKGSANIVHRLLHRSALPNIVDHKGHSALDLACDKGHSQLTWLMLWGGAIINTNSLMNACIKGFHEVVGHLIEYGADVNTADCNGKTMLMLACIYSQLAVVQVLLHRGSNPNIKDHNEQTALMHASVHC